MVDLATSAVSAVRKFCPAPGSTCGPRTRSSPSCACLRFTKKRPPPLWRRWRRRGRLRANDSRTGELPRPKGARRVREDKRLWRSTRRGEAQRPALEKTLPRTGGPCAGRAILMRRFYDCFWTCSRAAVQTSVCVCGSMWAEKRKGVETPAGGKQAGVVVHSHSQFPLDQTKIDPAKVWIIASMMGPVPRRCFRMRARSDRSSSRGASASPRPPRWGAASSQAVRASKIFGQ